VAADRPGSRIGIKRAAAAPATRKKADRRGYLLLLICGSIVMLFMDE
jgi:hypothetical protein